MNTKKVSRVSLFLVVVMVFFINIRPSLAQHNIYISAKGSDSWSGTKEKPFASFEKARNAVRDVLKRYGHDYGVTVWVNGGIYRFTKTFRLDSLDSGSAGAPVVYRALPGEKVHIMGGPELSASDFTHVKNEKILKCLTPNAREYVLQANLKALGITDYGKLDQYGHARPVVPAPLELFFNNRPMQLARYPNLGEIAIGKVIDPGSIPRYGDYSNRGGTFLYMDSEESKWDGEKDIWFKGTFKWGYSDDMIRVKSIDTVKHEITLATASIYGIGSGMPYQQYYAINILDELDDPGEYYLDRKTGILYFWPPAPMKGSRIMVSMMKTPLISLMGASHVTIRNFIIEDSREMGIYMERGGYNLIAGCTIRDLGTIGILMGQGSESVPGHPGFSGAGYEGRNVSEKMGDLLSHHYQDIAWNRHAGTHQGVLSCDIYYTGSGGVFLGGGSKKYLIPGHSFVKNCRIHDYDMRNKFFYAGVDVDGDGNLVSHNVIYNSGFQAIYASGNNHIFEYNIIHDVSMNSDDTSPWNTGGDPTSRGDIVRYNFFYNCGRKDRMIMGVYIDNGSCDVNVFGNVFYKVGTYGTVYSNSGQDISVKNNMFISSYGPAVHLKSMFYDFAKNAVNDYFGKKGYYRVRMTKQVDIYKSPYDTAYPDLQNYLKLMLDGKTYYGMRPHGNIMEWNVVYNCPQALRLTSKYAQFKMLNNYVTNKNPGFVDMDHLNFQLKDNSIVYKKLKGFKKIPFDEIGIYQDQYRTWN